MLTVSSRTGVLGCLLEKLEGVNTSSLTGDNVLSSGEETHHTLRISELHLGYISGFQNSI